MNSPTVEHYGRARRLLTVLLGFFTVAVALLWGWNTFAVEMLGQPAMDFKHAVALEVLILSTAVLLPSTGRFIRHGLSSRG